MKIKFHHIIIALLLTATGCKKDNYAAPSATFNGRLTYKGDPVNVEYNQVPFNLYQSGFGKIAPIVGTFDQEGNYSTLLFNGNYKFTIPANQGPFMWKELSAGKRDTIAVTISGNKTMDIEVMPYYMVRNAKITAASKTVTAAFNIEKVITDANAKGIDRVNLYINKTQFVSGGDQIASTQLNGSDITSLSNISMSVGIPSLSPTQNYVFARVGIKISGVEDMVFSPLVKVSF
ncbi:DUF3823 domain-containing protein [Mucilaginibacter ginsenosidivorax]|uniref:DUF3823 domain-containing protein n=1 Tax=Mucilaginibacter ginsenosidivorax TaxID=862126 RepID=A0A5B8WEB7_9SPHI|nr:DUF3823 domain-containing protein [Mucilaginibacter ginsenosidivorax]QEC80208.1 DUF3823 domain-containing protein [Mucilaginibacter ginsenosidivorax]